MPPGLFWKKLTTAVQAAISRASGADFSGHQVDFSGHYVDFLGHKVLLRLSKQGPSTITIHFYYGGGPLIQNTKIYVTKL